MFPHQLHQVFIGEQQKIIKNGFQVHSKGYALGGTNLQRRKNADIQPASELTGFLLGCKQTVIRIAQAPADFPSHVHLYHGELFEVGLV